MSNILIRILAVMLLACALAPRGAALAADLARDFRNPPASARPWVYWFWMDGNLSREGMTADLEAMKRAGIGGMIIMEVDVGVPKGPVKFMSKPWRTLFKHAVMEAERLGLEITLNAGPGWTGSGGPWVKPEQSMQHLVASALQVTGPADFNGQLPRPEPRKPHFVHAPVPTTLRQARNEFYRDVAVIAFPTPAAGPPIADSDEKALYYRNPYSSHPGVKPYLPAPAEYPAYPPAAAIARERVVDLTAQLTADGRLRWRAPEGAWTLMRFGRASTGANTRPAPQPGIGFECDKFDSAALDAHFEAFVGVLLRELPPRSTSPNAGWTMLHIDSWEMGAQNWTAKFREEFQRRRGYDPLPYLPAMTGRVVENMEISERFLWDLRQSAQELVIENHAQHLKALGRRHGFGLSIEPYDMNPCSDLSLGGVADVPMCEFWAQDYGFNSVFSCIEAVSIAHTMEKPIVAAEAFTSNNREAWRLHPGNMKVQADWAFCAGINRLVFHRFAHQPWLDRWPGMTMGPYGAHYERTQTWWDMADAWHLYLQRCQFMLRTGTPVVDICYLAPEGAPHVFRPPPSALRGAQGAPDRRGYNFDGCAPETLLNRMSVEDGRLVLPGGMSYRVLVLPEVNTMTPALLRKLKQLVEAGATVFGPPPKKSPSLSNYPKCDEEVRTISDELWGITTEIGERRFGRGRIIRSDSRYDVSQPTPESGALGIEFSDGIGRQDSSTASPTLYGPYDQVAELLSEMGVPPDFESDASLRYTHRRDGEVDIYFIANLENRPIHARCLFRVSGRRPELWDPVNGEIRVLSDFKTENGRVIAPLEFESQGSCFIVFRNEPAKRMTAGGPIFPEREIISEINGPWNVRFQPNRGAPKKIELDRLMDWSKHSDPGVQHFSGTAAYTCEFQIADIKSRIDLSLGNVRVMAQVKLNGVDVGKIWTPPFRVNITKAVKPGKNTLEIIVANLWPNRLIADQSLSPDQRVSWTTWNPYQKDTPLLESGLLGPVTLQTLVTGAAR